MRGYIWSLGWLPVTGGRVALLRSCTTITLQPSSTDNDDEGERKSNNLNNNNCPSRVVPPSTFVVRSPQQRFLLLLREVQDVAEIFGLPSGGTEGGG
ncbi:hypothetical protein Ddc_06633 [Ditylenchus destructor]|nr:hypothetical protein Ddc_06633 [Ditylenchus destructor]